MHVVSNRMIFDNHLKLTAFTSPTYHVYNKKAVSCQDSSFFINDTHNLKERNNIVLIGDSIGDVTMADGIHSKSHSSVNDNTLVLRIGFLNHNVERLAEYIKVYDVVLLGDPSFDFVNQLLADLNSPAHHLHNVILR